MKNSGVPHTSVLHYFSISHMQPAVPLPYLCRGLLLYWCFCMCLCSSWCLSFSNSPVQENEKRGRAPSYSMEGLALSLQSISTRSLCEKVEM